MSETGKSNKETWTKNHRTILEFIQKLDYAGASIQDITDKTSLTRQTIYDHTKKLMKEKSIVKIRKRYFSREFGDRNQKAEESYRKILGIREEDLSVRAGLPWFQRSDFNLTQFAPEKYLDSGKLVHSDILRRRSKLGDKKRAKLEALNYTCAFLENVKVEIETSIKEVKLQSGHRVTKIAAFLPFLQKVEKGWDAEVYDKAAWIMYCFVKEIALPNPTISPSDEIVVSIRLKPYDLTIRLLNAVYTFKKLEDLQRTKKLKGSEFTSIFPELQKTGEYQDLEKGWLAQDEKQRQWHSEHPDPLQYILDQIKRDSKL
jgi:hypothetical protein